MRCLCHVMKQAESSRDTVQRRKNSCLRDAFYIQRGPKKHRAGLSRKDTSVLTWVDVERCYLVTLVFVLFHTTTLNLNPVDANPPVVDHRISCQVTCPDRQLWLADDERRNIWRQSVKKHVHASLPAILHLYMHAVFLRRIMGTH